MANNYIKQIAAAAINSIEPLALAASMKTPSDNPQASILNRSCFVEFKFAHFSAALALHVTWCYTVTCNKQEFIMQANIAQRVQKHRAGLRAAGLRPVQIWVPDTRRSGFAEECRRQSLLLRGDALETDTLAWLEAAGNCDGWK